MSFSKGFGSIIATKNNHWFSRTFWLIAFIIATSVTIYHSYWLIWRYNYEPDFSVKVVQKPMRDIPFPAVTICSPVFAKNNLANYMRLGSIYKPMANFSVQEQNYFAANYQACNQFNELNDLRLVRKQVTNRTDFDIVKLLKESSMSVGELMFACKLGVRANCSKLFKPILTDKGFCYNFNMQNTHVIYNDIVSDVFRPETSKFRKFPREVDENITWTLDSGYSPAHKDSQIPYRAVKPNRLGAYLSLNEEHVKNVCPTIGKIYRVFFHMPNEIPTMFHVEYFAAFNYHKSFFLTAESFTVNNALRKYLPGVRRCYFQNERRLKFFKFYTKMQCDYECLTNYTLESCGCVKFSMPHEAGTPLCDIDQLHCVAQAMDRWPEKNDDNEIACNCLQTCNYIKYSLKYEKEALIDYVKGLLNKPLNSSDTVVAARFVEHLVLEHQTFVSYSLENFIADVGGLLGLFEPRLSRL